eukprot:scaffold193987_cov23-Tisochrysis_lutea.AAC.1
MHEFLGDKLLNAKVSGAFITAEVPHQMCLATFGDSQSKQTALACFTMHSNWMRSDSISLTSLKKDSFAFFAQASGT